MQIVLKNIWIFCVISVAFYFSIPAIYSASELINSIDKNRHQHASLPNYAQHAWSNDYFIEFKQLSTDFFSFIGWRRRPFRGDTINIETGMNIRHTPQIPSNDHSSLVYFFGGSTMWGAGSDDANTIPAIFNGNTGKRALNFGESGWVAHQSLNQLIKLYSEGHRPTDVVFYDGVNEVAHKCRFENDFWSDARETRIRQALRNHGPTGFWYYMQPVLFMARDIRGLFDKLQPGRRPNFYDCDTNSAKADLIAEQLITDWKIAAMLVESYGGRFHGYLQPVSYFSKTRLDQLDGDQKLELRNQYEAVYPIIRAKMAKSNLGTDITSLFDRDEYIFIDFCHVSPNGNAIIAERMAHDLSQPKSQ